MVLTIYDKYGAKRATVSPGDSSTQQKEVSGDNVLTLSFTHYEHIPLDVNDYADFEGERYWLTEKNAPKQNSEGEWVYDVKLYGIESMIKRFLVLETTDGNAEPVFTLTATAKEHVAMVVKCINDGMGNITDWKVGQVDGTDLIVIDYEGKYCDEALKEIAEKVGGSAEWWVEGQTVNICKCEHGEEITLGYGKGLTSLERDTGDTNKFYTRLFPIGSSRNIDAEEYGYSRLMLPDKSQYVELHTDEYGIYDHYEKDAFSDIYPRRTGEVSSVRSKDTKDDDGNEFTIYYFKDDTLTFDPNDYELAGETKRVSFQDGELAGLGSDDDHSFEVNYDSTTHEFEIITIWPYDDDTQLPGGKLVPKAGNHYILWNVRMPVEYYAMAEEEFLTAVEKYNEDHWKDISVYKAPTDHVWVEENAADLYVGRRVRLVSGKYFPEDGYRQSRITKITRKVNLPSQMDLEISDALQTGALAKVNDSIGELKSYTKAKTEGAALPDMIRSWDNTQPTDNNLFSARRSQQEFLSKKRNDRTKGQITFEQGVVFGQEENGGIDANGNASLSDVVVERVHDGDSTEAERTIIGAQGFDLYMGTDGKSHLYVDYLTARTRMFASSVEIRKVSYSGGTTLFSNAGSQICKVSDVYGTDGTVAAYKCFASADDGTTRTMNWWHIGMMALCQTFNVKAGESEELGNRYYWRMVVGVGQETLEDGKLYDYVMLSNVKSFKGDASTVPSHTKRVLANEDGDILVWGDVMVEVSVDDGMTSLSAAFSAQEGKSTDDDGIAISRKTYYGYEPKEDGTEPDAPLPFDVIVQAGDQIQWTKYGNLIKMSTSTEDSATDNAPSIAMYHNMGAQSLGNPYQWKTCTAVISPGEVKFNASLFKFFTDESENYDPWEEAREEAEKNAAAAAKTYTDAQLTVTKDAITLAVAERQGVKRNLLQGTACRKQGEGWTHMSGGKTYNGIRCEIIDRLNGIGGVNALHTGSRYVSASDYISAGFRWRGTDGAQGNVKVEKGKTYTLSFWAKTSSPGNMEIHTEVIWQGSATDNTRPAGYTGFFKAHTPATAYTLCTHTFEIPSDAAYEWVEVNIFMRSTDSTLREGYLCRPMLEEGGTYNGWTPSEHDYDYIGGNMLDNTGTLAEDGNLIETAEVSTDGDGVAVASATAASAASKKLLQFGSVALEANEDYLLSFYIKSDSAHSATSALTVNLVKNVLFAEYNGGESAYTKAKGSTTPSGYISVSAIASEWQRMWYHFRPAEDTTAQEIDLFVRGSGGEGALWLKKPKLERGAMPTEWTEKGTDFVDRTALLATGVDIENRKVTVTADKFRVRNNSGQETMLVTEDGKLNTDIVESRVLKTYLGGGMAGVVIEAGLMKVFNPDGNCNIQFGVNDDGYAVLSYYDNSGRKLYDLGPDGLDAKSQSDASLTGTACVLASTFLGTAETFYESSTYTAGGKDYVLEQALANFEAALFGGGLGSTPFSSAGTAVTLYRYIAARQQDTVIADSERNLTAALAKQADGKYFTSETICDGTKLVNLASGVHFLKTEAVVSAPAPMSSETFTYPAYDMTMMSFLNGTLTKIRLYSRTEKTVSPFV